jgi:beta-galactosidase
MLFSCSGLQAVETTNIQWTEVEGSADVNDGRWHHLAGVYDGKKISLYVDGKQDASKAAWGNGDKNNYPVYIGENSESLGRPWNGLIDDVRIYSYALSEAEVKALYEGKEPPRKKE